MVLRPWGGGGFLRCHIVQMSFFSRSFSRRTPSWQILSLFPLEVKHLLTDESIWKARTSLQRPKTMAAAIKHKNTQPGPPLASGGGLQPPPPNSAP